MAFSGTGALSGAATGAAAGASLGPWGALGGGIIGGLAGAFGGGDDKPKTPKIVKKAFEYQKFYDKNKVQWLVEDAKAAGIHPLAALGGSFGGSAVQQPGGSYAPSGQSAWGDAIGDVFGAMPQIAGAFQKGDGRDMRGPSQSFGQRRTAHLKQSLSDNLDIEFKRASIEEVRSRTLLNNARMAELTAAPVSGVVNDPEQLNYMGIPVVGDAMHAQRVSDARGDLLGEISGLARVITHDLPEAWNSGTGYKPPDWRNQY